MSNLLENALEASLKTAPANRRIKVQAHLHSDYMVLLTVENAFEGMIHKKDGVFQSSKRRGEGVGIQSVRHIAEKNGGYSRFFTKMAYSALMSYCDATGNPQGTSHFLTPSYRKLPGRRPAS